MVNKNMRYIFLALMAMVLMGVVDFLLKKALAAGTDIYAISFLGYTLAGILFGISSLVKGGSIKMSRPLLKYAMIVGLLIFLGTFAFLAALKTGSASVIVPIVRMGFVVTAICAFFFLKETVTLKKGLGLLFAAISLVLLSQ